MQPICSAGNSIHKEKRIKGQIYFTIEDSGSLLFNLQAENLVSMPPRTACSLSQEHGIPSRQDRSPAPGEPACWRAASSSHAVAIPKMEILLPAYR